MNLFIQLWSPRQAWLDLTTKERQDFMAGIAPDMLRHAEMGIELLGMGAVDPTTDAKTDHKYWAVWKMPNDVTLEIFEADVRRGGWYKYFDQVNARGAIRTAEAVLGEHVTGK